jgi:hypothetical protein
VTDVNPFGHVNAAGAMPGIAVGGGVGGKVHNGRSAVASKSADDPYHGWAHALRL